MLHRKLVITIGLYLLYLSICTLGFAAIHMNIARNAGQPQPFSQWLLFTILAFASMTYTGVSLVQESWLLLSVQFVVNSIATPVFAGIIFYHILNRRPNIVFPKNLLLRRRTSEGKSATSALCIKIANRGGKRVYNLSCQLVYSYFQTGPGVYNRETCLTQTASLLLHTHQFSFDIKDFPSIFVRTHLDKSEPNYRNDKFVIIISGKVGQMADPFSVEKEYGFADIVVAKRGVPLYTYSLQNGELVATKPQYQNLDKLIPLSESERGEFNATLREHLVNIGSTQ